jgi:hypothetical protein
VSLEYIPASEWRQFHEPKIFSDAIRHSLEDSEAQRATNMSAAIASPTDAGYQKSGAFITTGSGPIARAGGMHTLNPCSTAAFEKLADHAG